MGKHSGDVKAAWAFDIHKEAIGALNQPLELVFSLISRCKVRG